MLVLSRKLGERIVIADNVTIEVLQIKGNCIRLGITAPSGVRIMREELLAGEPKAADHDEPVLTGAASR